MRATRTRPGRATLVAAGYTPLDVIRASSTVERRAGGTAANVAAILAHFGWETAVAGQTGSDTGGEILIADLAAAGVNVSCLDRHPGPAARVIHEITPGGHRFRFVCPECRQRLPRNRPLSQAGAERCLERNPRPGVYFFDRATPATVWLAERYADRDGFVVFEPSIPANAALLQRAVSVADVVKYSDDTSAGGLDELTAEPRPDQLRVVTHGAAGLEVRVGVAAPQRIPAMPARVVDAGGAGDWTTAGILLGLMRRPAGRRTMARALMFGQALGALSCSAVGGRGLMRRRPETITRAAERLQAGDKPGLRDLSSVAGSRYEPSAGACTLCLLPGGVESTRPTKVAAGAV